MKTDTQEPRFIVKRTGFYLSENGVTTNIRCARVFTEGELSEELREEMIILTPQVMIIPVS